MTFNRHFKAVCFSILFVLGYLACSGCTDPPPGTRRNPAVDGGSGQRWPKLPRSVERVQKLAKRMQAAARRVEVQPERPAVSPPSGVVARLRAAVYEGRAIGSWPMMRGWLSGRSATAKRAGRRLLLLWGVHHDAPAHVLALRRLVLHPTMRAIDLLVLELFDATGAWRGVGPLSQAGDDALLRRYVDTGDLYAWSALAKRQQRHNYTAWKYGYLDEVMDLLLAVRALGKQIRGCDMSVRLRQVVRRRLRPTANPNGAQALMRLRELHCALSLRESLSGGLSVAMLWGKSHLADNAFPSLLAATVDVVRMEVIGGRLSADGKVDALGQSLRLTSPLLVPSKRRLGAVLLNAGALRAHVGRARRVASQIPKHERGRLRVRSAAAGQLWLKGKRLAVSKAARVSLQPGTHPFLFEGRSRAIAGTIHMPSSGFVQIDLDAQRARVRFQTTVADGAVP